MLTVSTCSGAPAGGVEFCDVVFGYSLGGRVLHGVSFSVSGGQTVALVGATGSGKVGPCCGSKSAPDRFGCWVRARHVIWSWLTNSPSRALSSGMVSTVAQSSGDRA